MDELVRECARLVLENMRAERADEAARACVWEERGYRIMQGGQTTGYENGVCGWEITDWRTGEVLRTGTGTIEDYGNALDELFPDGKYIPHDRLYDAGETEEELGAATAAQGAFIDFVPDLPGLPASLAEVIRDWTESAPAEEVAAWTRCSADQVRAAR